MAVFYFENYDTMWHQVHEMLYVERGGEAQIADELTAFNPLIPKGRELVATVMFEIDEPQRRRAILSRIGRVEETAFIRFAGTNIVGRPEADVDRTNSRGQGKFGSSFIHFALDNAQIAAFRRPETGIVIGFSHPAYAHVAVMTDAVREALAEDFD